VDDFLPITDEREVQAFLQRIPVVVDRERFTRFVLGFPHRYLQATSPVEIVAHFALVSTLGARTAVSRLSRDGAGWKLVVVAADRRALFSRISGSLSVFGADITSAEAFSNREAVVLDTFLVTDVDRRFEQPEEGRRFQVFLEQAIEDQVDLVKELESRGGPVRAALQLTWNDEAHPAATLLSVDGADAFGILHAISRRLSEAGAGIELAEIATRSGRIHDEFYLTGAAGKLSAGEKAAVEQALSGLATVERRRSQRS
jgi:[protein-PII] uridylyltransferase